MQSKSIYKFLYFNGIRIESDKRLYLNNFIKSYLYMRKLCGIIKKHSSSHRHKTIILYFLTTTFIRYFLVKLQVWINHVDTWRHFDHDTTSMQLRIYFVLTLKQLCLSKAMQLYKAINSFKSIFLGFWAMLQSSYTVENILENTYFVFCILYYTFQRLLLVDTNKKIDSFSF